MLDGATWRPICLACVTEGNMPKGAWGGHEAAAEVVSWNAVWDMRISLQAGLTRVRAPNQGPSHAKTLRVPEGRPAARACQADGHEASAQNDRAEGRSGTMG